MDELIPQDDLGFTARVLTLATMPHRKVDGNEYERRNGAFVLSMMAPSKIGLPYGSYPRLMVAWLGTEVQRTQAKTLVLGPSLGRFMRDLGLTPSAGRWGTKTRVRDQIRRLFSCSISGRFTDDGRDAGINFPVAEQYSLWWGPQSEDQAALWQSTVTLGDRFYRELLEHPVPISLAALRDLKRSPLALDIYAWLTHRMSYLGIFARRPKKGISGPARCRPPSRPFPGSGTRWPSRGRSLSSAF